jgi:xanthine dehydrogenase accessory factor
LLACTANGDFIGSLSGGCVEENLLERIKRGEFSAMVSRIRYGAVAEESDRLGLPCGGILDIAIEKISATEVNQLAITSVEEALSLRQKIFLKRDFISNLLCTAPPVTTSPMLAVNENDSGELLAITQVLGPQCRLLLIGISEVSRSVAQMALLLDYEVLVCDPRVEKCERWNIAGVRVLAGMPDEVVREYGDDPSCAILALTHDPRIDDMGLMEAFNTQALYIGAMGSLKTSQKRRERLQLLDVTEQQLQRLHAPIGLDTGSKTPAEIAVSVLAELTAVRAGKCP